MITELHNSTVIPIVFTSKPYLSNQGYNIIGITLACLSVIGFLCNSCVLLIFIVNKSLRSPTNFFIIALSVCDLCMTVCSTIAASASFKHGWVFGDVVCTIEGFAVYFLGLTSMYLLAAISVDRYMVIVKPLLGSRITERVAVGAIILCWCCGFFWASLPLVGWNHYTTEGVNISCSVVWHSKDVATFSYIVTIFVFCLIVPMCLMVFSYFNIYMTIRSMSRNSLWAVNSRMSRKQQLLERKMLKTAFTLVAVYIFSWTPYTVVSFLSAFGPADIISPLMATLPAIIAKCSGLWNPFVYVGTNAQFRNAFCELVRCSKVKNTSDQFECKTENSLDKESRRGYSTVDIGNGISKASLLAATPVSQKEVHVYNQGTSTDELANSLSAENGHAQSECVELKDLN